jgi:molecular chaperone HscB
MQNYFSLFNLEPRYSLAPPQLDAAYRSLVTQVHPDRYAQASAAEQRQAMTLAANANEAYRTLKQPTLRARHLLELRGLNAGDHKSRLSPNFLIEQMEWREQLRTARTLRDGNALKNLGNEVKQRLANLQLRLELQLDIARNDPAALDCVQQLMFIEKLVADIDEASESLQYAAGEA